MVKLRGILVALNVRKLLIGAGAGLALLAQGAAVSARDNAPLSSPFEVGESPAGNYLAALVAGAGKDTLAAATFFREALRLSLIHI